MPGITILKKSPMKDCGCEWDRLNEKQAELNERERRITEIEEYGKIHSVEPNRICPNPFQPRKNFDDEAITRLAESIKQYGILQPLTVRKLCGSGDGSLYELIAGERRLRAAKLLKLDKVPCIIINADCAKSAELAIIENLQREDLNMFEQAVSISALINEYHLTQDEIAGRLCVSQPFIANKLRLLKLGTHERDTVISYHLTERHARALLKLPTAEERMKAMGYIHSKNLNVAASEKYIDSLLTAKPQKIKRKPTRKIILKDIKIFYNSLDKAVSILKQAGLRVENIRTENASDIELSIKIYKN